MGFAKVAGPPSRRAWAVALASWAGGVVGSFVAPSMDSLGISTGGSTPLLGGSAALFAAFALGAAVGSTTGALVAFLVGRRGHERIAAASGAGAGIVLSVVAGYLSEIVAEWWAGTFFQYPLSAGLVGGALAGGFAGVAAVALLRGLRSSGPKFPKERRFATLSGSVAGLWAGLGGGALGEYLALAKCPEYAAGYGGPVVLAGCGFTQGAIALGAWAGAAVGALSAFLTALVLSRTGSSALGADSHA